MDMDNNIIKDIQTRQMNMDTDNKVAIANDMIKGVSNLSLSEAKLLRLLIMQVVPEDDSFYMFSVKASDFAKLLGIDKSNLYKEMHRMVSHLISEVISIGDGNPKHPWKKFHWVDYCDYKDGVLTIELSKHLSPYIIGLKQWYTQYRLEEIIYLNSVYAIRLYELIVMAMKSKTPYADNATEVYIDAKTIRKATGTEDKYQRVSQFKEKVINTAIREINKHSSYHVSVRDYKEARRIAGFYFLVESATWHRIKEEDPERAEQISIENYMKKMGGKA